MTRSKREILRKRRYSRISISAIVRVDLIIFLQQAIYQYDFKKKNKKHMASTRVNHSTNGWRIFDSDTRLIKPGLSPVPLFR